MGYKRGVVFINSTEVFHGLSLHMDGYFDQVDDKRRGGWRHIKSQMLSHVHNMHACIQTNIHTYMRTNVHTHIHIGIDCRATTNICRAAIIICRAAATDCRSATK